MKTKEKSGGNRGKPKDKKSKSPETNEAKLNRDGLIVVGIGASAGGLDAIKKLIPNLPVDSKIAYVILQHLDPNHPGKLLSLLERYSRTKMTEIVDRVKIEPNTIYITPFGKNVKIENDRLILTDPKPSLGPRPSVDHFFTSLANDKGAQAVGIILSGTGSDGSRGIRAIKAEGGITIVQEVKSAKYTGMPQAAIDTGLVDLTLPPEKMGPELSNLLEYPKYMTEAFLDKAPSENLYTIFELLLERTNSDFSEYKLSTINRRIERRMAVHKISNLADYIRLLKSKESELFFLFKDILISVTGFFRDPEAFESLSKVIMKIIENKRHGDHIRIWLPGSATGEETYSVAILLAEVLGEEISKYNIQIFSTDIDMDAINIARKGVYTGAAMLDMEEAILNRYFTRRDGYFVVKRQIREMVIFARQDMTRDPPFSKLDLIVCRNVLIYFNTVLQKKLIPIFHYTLNPIGYLFLGKSETIGQFDDLFSVVDRKWKIYRRRGTFRAPIINLGIPKTVPSKPPQKILGSLEGEKNLRDLANYNLAKTYGHPSVIIDDRMEIMYVHGDVNPYLSLSSGEIDLNILNMSRKEIRIDLRTLIHRVVEERVVLRSKKLKIELDGMVRTLTVSVIPIEIKKHTAQCLTMVIFEEENVVEGVVNNGFHREEGTDPYIKELKNELAETKEHLYSIIEEYESTNEEFQSLNEELQSANEELQSANEELQSSNEELETVNEDLQSTNEDLNTINEEYQIKSGELAAAKADLENILNSVDIAIIIVDRDLKVRRFTPPASKIFQLTAADVGRIIRNIPCLIKLPKNFFKSLDDVIVKERGFGEEFRYNNKIFLLRISPFYNEDSEVEGAVVILVD
ncbi:MAG: PAS domain-containing protein [Deltaproteobacteria bacterium]|uniref:protein-glutamate O-methyltransferase n=1 Tax=Candidatus Zymogenus saltonus TaxID=2844893 RepID=A0A9D8PP93_9DELT|nr:PAS domain-containing protein [Candidatus Zymogenus saltonus]